jgi:hypothetical protein
LREGGRRGYVGGKVRWHRKLPPVGVSAYMESETGQLDEKRLTSIVFAVVTDHKHDFPLEYIIVHQPARYSREVFRGLYLLELACQQACCT